VAAAGVGERRRDEEAHRATQAEAVQPSTG
jgi:hypothetical protein